MDLQYWLGTKQLYSHEPADAEAAHPSQRKQQTHCPLPPSLLGFGDDHITNHVIEVTISGEYRVAYVLLFQ